MDLGIREIYCNSKFLGGVDGEEHKDFWGSKQCGSSGFDLMFSHCAKGAILVLMDISFIPIVLVSFLIKIVVKICWILVRSKGKHDKRGVLLAFSLAQWCYWVFRTLIIKSFNYWGISINSYDSNRSARSSLGYHLHFLIIKRNEKNEVSICLF